MNYPKCTKDHGCCDNPPQCLESGWCERGRAERKPLWPQFGPTQADGNRYLKPDDGTAKGTHP